jgi:hypothetical protein
VQAVLAAGRQVAGCCGLVAVGDFYGTHRASEAHTMHRNQIGEPDRSPSVSAASLKSITVAFYKSSSTAKMQLQMQHIWPSVMCNMAAEQA